MVRPALQSPPPRTALDERNGFLEMSPNQSVHPRHDIEGTMSIFDVGPEAPKVIIGFLAFILLVLR
jgi:hypothetical protein